MVLPTMNDYEKGFEAFRIAPVAIKIHKEYKDTMLGKFKKGTKFPYFQRVTFDDDRGNKWWLTYLCKNKKEARNCNFWCFCYTVYEIQKKKTDGSINKYDGNTGKGVILFDPFALNSRQYGDGKGFGLVIDIVPHAFNRYTQRYLKPKGKENIEFQRKVENIMARWGRFDIDGDISSDKHGNRPYDVFMSGGGMLRGQLETELLLRFYTYIDGDMMFDNQVERQDEMRKEYHKWMAQGIFERK